MRLGRLRNKILLLVLPLTLTPFILTAVAVQYLVVRSYESQIREEQDRRVASAIVDIRRELELAMRNADLITRLPGIGEYLRSVSDQTAQSRPPSGAMQEQVRALVQPFFEQNAFYLRIILVDAQGLERIKLSRLPGDSSLKSISGEEVFRRALIGLKIQTPVIPLKPGRYMSTVSSPVVAGKFSGIVLIDLDLAVFQRSLRPLLASDGVATFLFDDRGIVFERSFGDAADEVVLEQVDTASEAVRYLTLSPPAVPEREIRSGQLEYLFSIVPAESLIRSIEPQSGQNWFLGVVRPKQVLPDQARSFQIVFIVILLAAIGSVLWASRYYARRITSPLEQLAGVTVDIARGRFDVELGFGTGDEVEDLARAVQRMAVDLQQYQRDLVESERLAVMGEMTAEISHEIQNRLGGISLWIQHLDAELARDDSQREILDELKKGVKDFELMLAGLKSYYRCPSLEFEVCEVDPLVERAIRDTRSAAEEGQVQLEYQGQASCRVLADREGLHTVLVNLLRNAVEASPQGETASIRVSQDAVDGKTVVRFEVSDRGYGIRPEDQQRIFLPFYSTKSSGGGIGLALASKMVRAHGGKIHVKSAPGKGSVFTVTLPGEGE